MQNFKRYEEKYLISQEQCAELRKVISQRMEPDCFGEYMVQNLYYDTENWDVIRASTEKPFYKEKMRLRCYDIPDTESQVFLELKKKYRGIVYKRRGAIPFRELSYRSIRDVASAESSQVLREFNFYLKNNEVLEKIYIVYMRAAIGTDCGELRVTFDSDIRFRLESLDYLNPEDGTLILPRDKIVMEIKSPGGMPLWMSRLLCENKIFPTAFSKYGECYTGYIMKRPEFKRREQLSV